jgi:hypothetical protein
VDFDTLREVPKDIRDGCCKFYGKIEGKTFFAEHYVIDHGVLQLIRTLMDSSDVAQGIVLKERWSFLEFFAVSQQFKWTIRSMGPEER